MSNSDFNILIGVDMTNAESEIKKSIDSIGDAYKLKLNLIIGNKDKFFKQIRTIQELFLKLGKLDIDFGLKDDSKDVQNIKKSLKEISQTNLDDVGEQLAKDMKAAKKATDDLTKSYDKLMKVSEKVKPNKDTVKITKTGNKYNNTTVSEDSKKGTTVDNVKDFASLNSYMEKAKEKINSFENVSKDGRSKNSIDKIKNSIDNLPKLLASGDNQALEKSLEGIQKQILKYDDLEKKIKQKGAAEQFQLSKVIDLNNKLAKIQREGLANNKSVANLKNLMDTFSKADFSNIDDAKRKFSAIERQLKTISGQEDKEKFKNKKATEGEKHQKRVKANIDPELVGQQAMKTLSAQIKQVFDSESIKQFENAVKRVNHLYDEMLEKQKKVLEQRKMDAMAVEDRKKIQDKLKSLDDEQANREHEKKVENYSVKQRKDKVTSKENDVYDKKATMVGSGFIDNKEFDEVENRLRELKRLASSVHIDDLDVDKELSRIDNLMAKISSRYEELDAKQRKIRVSTHDWNKEIDQIKSKGFVNESEFDNIRKAMRGLSADSKTYEQDLKRIQTQIARMNTLSEKRSERKETRDITKGRNDAKIEGMRGTVPDRFLDEVKGLNNLIDFSSSKKDIALIEDEMRKLAKLEEDIKNAGRDEAKIREAIAEHQRNAIKLTDKYNDALAEIVHNSNRQIQDAERRNSIEQEAIRIQREINELRERGTQLSYDEQRAIQQRLLALRQLSQRQRDVEVEGNDRDSTEQRIKDKFNSTSYRAKRGFSENSAEARKVQAMIDEIEQKVQGLGNKVGDEFKQATREIEEAMNRLNSESRRLRDEDQRRRGSMSGQLVNALRKVPIWTAAMGVVYGTIQQVKDGFQSVLDIDKAMINLSKVSEASKMQLDAFRDTASAMGRDLGVVASEVIKATTEFQRLGYTLQQATVLGKNSILYANVGDMSVEDASANLVSTIKGFGVEVDTQGNNVRNLVDMFNEVGNNFAISSEGIGEALKRSSSVFKEAGTSIQDAVGLVTAANAVVQDPKKVGNGLKTIAMRLRGVSEEGEEVKELVPQLQGTFDRINKEFGLMGKEALNVMKEDKVTFKSTYEIFEEVVKVWDKLSDLERANLVETMGGKHQGVVVSAIIQNWQDAQKASETASNSAGSASREFSAYMDGFEYKIGQLKNALEKFWTTVIDDDAVKSIIDAITSIIDGLTWLVDTFGATNILVLMSGLVAIMASKPLRDSVTTVGALGRAFEGLGGFVMNFISFLPRLIPYIGVLLAIGTAVTLVYKAFTAESRARKERLKVLDSEISKLQDFKKTYEDTFEKKDFNLDDFADLQAKGTSRTTQEEEKYLDVVQKIKSEMPELISYYNEKNEAVIKSAEEIRNLVKANNDLLLIKETEQFKLTMDETSFKSVNKKLREIKEAQAQISANDGMDKVYSVAKDFITNEIDEINESNYFDVLNKFNDKVRAEYAKMSQEQKDYSFQAMQGLQSLIPTSRDKNEALKTLDIFIANNEEFRQLYKEENNKMKASLQTGTDDVAKLIDNAFNIFTRKNNISANSNTFLFIEELRKNMQENMESFGTDMEKTINDIPNYINDAIKNVQSKGISIDDIMTPNYETFELTKAKLEELKASVQDSSDPIIQVYDALIKKHLSAKNAIDNAPITPFEFNKDVMGQVHSMIGDISDLDSAYRTLADGEKLSLSTTMDLITKHPELIKSMKMENGVLSLTGDALKEVAKIREQEFKANLTRIREERVQSLAKTKEMIENANAEIKKIQDKMKAYNELNKVMGLQNSNPMFVEQKPKNPWGFDIPGMDFMTDRLNQQAKAEQDKLKAQLKEQEDAKIKNEKNIKDTEDAIANIDKLLTQDWSGQLGSITGGGKDKKAKDLQDAIYVVDQYKKRIDWLNRSIEKQQKLQGENSIWTDAYKKALNEETWLTMEKKKAIDAEIASLNEQIKKNKIAKTGMISIDPKANENKTQRAIAAELQQEIDQAEDRLRELGSESDAAETRINELRMMKVQTMTEFYNIQREMLTDDIAYQEYAMSLYDETTDGYRKHANEKLELLKEQQKYNKEELDFLIKERDTNKSLTNAQINDLNELIRQKKMAVWDMAKMIEEMNTLIINSNLDKQLNRMASETKKYSDAISDIQDSIKYDLDEDKDMGKHIDYLKQIIALRKGEQADVERNIKYLEEQLEANRDNKEVVEKISSELESWKDKLKDTKNAIKDTNLEIKEIYKKMADDYVNMYKEQLELMKQADEKYYADKIEAEQKAHEKRMKQLDKEMKALDEAYAKQMKMIDRAEAARSHDNDVSKLQKEADELKKQIDLLSMDDSYEAKAKKAELVKQLTEKEMQLSELEHNREVELRKNNLEDDLEAEKEKLENKKEKYEDDNKNYIESLEEKAKKRQEYWEAELINEKKFAEMRKQVLEGNFTEMEATIKTWSENVSGQMGNLGQQVTDNFTMKVREAIESIKQLNSMNIKSFNDSTTNTGTKNKDGDLKEPSTPPKNNELEDNDVIEEMKRNSWRWKNAKTDEERNIYYQANQKLGASIGATYKNGSWFKNGKKLYELRSGGYTGDWSGDGGRLAVLHKKELVLNQDQTKNILDAARIVERMKSFAPSLLNISSPKASEPVATTGNSEHNEYNIEVNINGNADRKVADTVADQIINKIKRTKGGRF